MKAPSPRDLLRAAARHRVLLAAGLAAAAMTAALGVLAPSSRAGVGVLVAAQDLAAGTVLTDAHLETVVVPQAAVPDGTFSPSQRPVGRLLAGAIRRGEPLTDVRLLGSGLLTGLDRELVAAPLRLADPAAAAYLQAGDHIDVLATSVLGASGAAARLVAAGLAVLAVPAIEGDTAEGALVVVAATPAVAARLAAAMSDRLTATVLPR
ncbi:MAG TPA: SAF domain-containing protein [Mycobacteriales bacterium]|nr:SAF domain-containing protein [Mycobacteriales bacterium]